MAFAASFVELFQNITLPVRGKADGCDAAGRIFSAENTPITQTALAWTLLPSDYDSILDSTKERRGHALDNNSDFVGAVAAGTDWTRRRQLDSPAPGYRGDSFDHQPCNRPPRGLAIHYADVRSLLAGPW